MRRWTYGLVVVAAVVCTVLLWTAGHHRVARSGAHAVTEESHRPTASPHKPGASAEVTGSPNETVDSYWVTQVVSEDRVGESGIPVTVDRLGRRSVFVLDGGTPPKDKWKAVSGPTGTVRIGPLRPGVYRATYGGRPSTFGLAQKVFVFEPPHDPGPSRLALLRTLLLTVKITSVGAPFPGCQVSVSKPGIASTDQTTDENGRVMFFLSRGKYRIRVFRSGSCLSSQGVTLKRHDRTVEVDLGRLTVVRGRVLSFGVAVPGARVTCRSGNLRVRTTLTDVSGGFVFDTVHRDLLIFASHPVHGRTAQSVDLAADAPDIALTLERGQALRVLVREQLSGAVIEALSVGVLQEDGSVRWTNAPVERDAVGVRLEGLYVDGTLMVRSQGWGTVYRTVKQEDLRVGTITISLDPEITVSGRVITSTGQRAPVFQLEYTAPGIPSELSPVRQRIVNREGRFIIRGLSVGVLRLRCLTSEGQTSEKLIEVQHSTDLGDLILRGLRDE